MAAAKAYSGQGGKGGGGAQAGCQEEVEKMEEERKAYWHAFVRGITARRGQFLH